MALRPLFCSVLTVLLAALLLTPAHAEHPDPALHDDLLRDGGGGAAVVAALGSDLPEAARRNSLPTQELREILTEDPSARVGRDGRLYYSEPVPAVSAEHGAVEPGAAEQESGPGPVAAQAVTAIDPADAYTLHSQPEGRRDHTVFLDFDGYTLSDKSWWVTDAEDKITPGDYGGVDATDAQRRAFAITTWRIVAERYAPFDIDVTTEDPGAAALNRTSSADHTWGSHVVFTDELGPLDEVCDGSCGGSALIATFDSIDNGTYEPTWAFTSVSRDAPASAQLATHEIGHTLDLAHDGNASTTYHSGGNRHWVPVMGATNGHALQQFSQGEYTGATNHEDDLGMIAAAGAGWDPDDWGNLANPTVLDTDFADTITGVIGRAEDDDTFSMRTTCAGDLRAEATGIGLGTSLDLRVDILDAAGAHLTHADPVSGAVDNPTRIDTPTGVDATAVLPATPAATYRIKVDGVGSGSPAVDGYSDYGSVGSYTLRISGCADPALGTVPTAPTGLTVTTAGRGAATLAWTAPSSDGGHPITGYRIGGVGTTIDLPAGATTRTLTGFRPGATYQISVQALNKHGASGAVTTGYRVPTWTDVGAPAFVARPGERRASVYWSPAPNPGNATTTGWRLTVERDGRHIWSGTAAATARSFEFPSLATGAHVIRIQQLTTADDGIRSSVTAAASFRLVAPPWVPPMLDSWWGRPGAPVTAMPRWGAPLYTGGAPITAYRAIAYQVNSRGHITAVFTSPSLPPTARYYDFPLPSGDYKFRVIAYNGYRGSTVGAFSDVNRAR